MSVLAFPVAVLLAASPPASKSAVYQIDTQCTAAVKLDDAHRQDAHYYADFSGATRPGPDDGSGKWRAFKSADELKAAAAKQPAPNTHASIWKASDGTTIALLHFTNDAGDWTDDTEYCFRPDGTLARAADDLMNMDAQVYGHRTLWFGADGTVLHRKEKASESGARRKPGPDLMADLHDTIVYPAVKTLPFLAPTTAPAAAAPAKKPAAKR
jgi:hypothetical protein